MICEEKIWYTGERVIRLARFYNVEIHEVINSKTGSKCLEDLWIENKSISPRDDRGELFEIIHTIFQKIKEQISQEILIEGPAKNEFFCNNLIKIFVGEKST
jgi:2-hydroxy-3-keto-5-methylthiopentenyl-1-phosphate phosphatase